MLEETNAAYLEDLDTIAVIRSGSVTDQTLIHELTHALQRQRWGPLPTPRTFEAQYLQAAWLEHEALRVEGWSRGYFTPREFPTDRAPAHYWLGVDPALVGPVGTGRTGLPRVGDPVIERSPLQRGEPEVGWRGLPYGPPPRDPGWPTGRSLGPLGANEQIIGQRGFAWWVRRVIGFWPSGFSKWLRMEPGWWWSDDRLRIGPEELVWKIEVSGFAGALANRIRRDRPQFGVETAGELIVVRIPLPPRE